MRDLKFSATWRAVLSVRHAPVVRLLGAARAPIARVAMARTVERMLMLMKGMVGIERRLCKVK